MIGRIVCMAFFICIVFIVDKAFLICIEVIIKIYDHKNIAM
jgi:hypothetical protein